MQLNVSERIYIAGEKELFDRRQDLVDAFAHPFVSDSFRGQRLFHNLFVGLGGTKSDVHNGFGFDVFMMLAGQKRWVMFPPMSLARVYAVGSCRGYHLCTRTKVGYGPEPASPWIQRLPRMEFTLHPGDVLVHAPLYWHGVVNAAQGPGEAVVGITSRVRLDP